MREGIRKSGRVARLNKFSNLPDKPFVIHDGEETSCSSDPSNDFVLERWSNASHDPVVSKPEGVEDVKGKRKTAERKVSNFVFPENEGIATTRGSVSNKQKAKVVQCPKVEKKKKAEVQRQKKEKTVFLRG